MDFIVNEQGCRQLTADMLRVMREIALLVGEIESRNTLLRSALGEDYEAIASTVRIMGAELEDARRAMDVVAENMREYMSRVHQARISLRE